MPATPIHGTQTESEQAAWFRCSSEEGGPVHELKKELGAMGDKLGAMQTAFVELKTTFWTGIKAGVALLSVLTVAVAILAYLQAGKDHGSHVVPQAHAETKGTP